MEVNNVSGSGSLVTPNKGEQNILNKDDFLKLLMVQMKNQNPLEPMSDQEFMSQMAQFSSLEQLQNLSLQAEANQALSLVGAEITVIKDGEFVTGVAEKVMFSDGKPFLFIGDYHFTLDQVVQVAIPTQSSEETGEDE
ncbi:MAG: flagellar hook capping FlgD N-terminal domain-containing protein [Zhaonellaceae bacterium]|jgi:flagellar basal-body rod modification protein FlgD|nr:flagellar hook assembly protein FlgD [Clostridia bacterium]